MVKNDFYELRNGVKIPKLGFGTWQLKGSVCYNAVLTALRNGYTHIDTAYIYDNEEEVGKAIKDSHIDRKNLFIVTKLPDYVKTYDETISYFYHSLENLDLDYVDLFLIHAPWPWSNVGEDCKEGNVDVWKAMIHLYNLGKVKSIGVSNFHPEDIKPLIDETGFIPHVNQIRFFIGNTQEPVTKYCQDNGILVEAYSPLATSELVNNEIIANIAKKYNVTNAQIALKYVLNRGCLPLPRSTNEERIKLNMDLDFEISESDMDYLNNLYHIASTRPYRS